MWLRLLLYCILFILPLIANANSDTLAVKNPLVAGIKSHYGFIIPHTNSVREISTTNPWSVQLELSRHMNTQKAWDYCGCYPKIGFLFNYTNYDNPEILGSSYTLAAFLEPYITFKGIVNPSFRLGFGLSYLDQVYDPVTNPQNLFYSFPVSFYMLASLGINVNVSERVSLNLMGNYSHISNGRIKQPNKGINYPTISLGLDYKLDNVHLVDRVRLLTKRDIHQKIWKWDLNFYVSGKEINENEKKYQVYGLQVTSGYILNRLSAINLGVEINHDRSLVERNRRNAQQSEDSLNPTTFALLLRHEFLMGRFILSQALGYYLNRPMTTSPRFYQRAGLAYRINDLLNLGINLKTHTSNADFIDFRLGIMF